MSRALKIGCLISCLVLCFFTCLTGCDEKTEVAKEEQDMIDSESDTKMTDVSPTNEKTELPEKPQTFSLSSIAKNLKIYGRCSQLNGGITCDMAASGIEFSAYCEGDVALSVSSKGDTYFSVWIDGIRKEDRIKAQSGSVSVTVAEQLSKGEHVIRILKQTGPKNSSCILNGLTMRGTLLDAPSQKELYIEFVGDSITSGYGNLTSGKPADVGTALYQDGTQTYAFLTAQALDADFMMTSCSGIGIQAGYVDFTMKDYYPCNSYFRDTKAKFVPTRVPDLIVINLGTNDYSKKADKTAFAGGVEILINNIRATYGADVPIVWAYNMMNDGYNAQIKSALQKMGGEAKGLYSCELPRNTSGGNSHPSLAGHRNAAEVLTKYIKDMGLAD